MTNFVFENCTFGHPTRPGLIMGADVAPVLFKNDKMNGVVVRSAAQLKADGFELLSPVKFAP